MERKTVAMVPPFSFLASTDGVPKHLPRRETEHSWRKDRKSGLKNPKKPYARSIAHRAPGRRGRTGGRCLLLPGVPDVDDF